MVLTKRGRRSIRLKHYDYSQNGLYFITICTQHRVHFFGDIVDNEMVLNDAGKMIQTQWIELLKRFENIQLHEFVIMPNHFHGIIEIKSNPTTVGVPPWVPKPRPKGNHKGLPQRLPQR